MTIAERVKTAGTMKADCIISLHVNAGFGKKSTGYEIYFPGFQQDVSGGKRFIAHHQGYDSQQIPERFRAACATDPVRSRNGLPARDGDLRDAPSPLLDGLTIPGLVVEIGFATHPDDRKKLTEPETQKAIANAVIKGLQNYFSSLP